MLSALFIGAAVEEAHQFDLDLNHDRLLIISDEYNGIFLGEIAKNRIFGKIKKIYRLFTSTR